MEIDDLKVDRPTFKFLLIWLIVVAIYLVMLWLSTGKLHEYLSQDWVLSLGFTAVICSLFAIGIRRNGLVIGTFRATREESSATYTFFLWMFSIVTALCVIALVALYFVYEV